MATVSPLLSWLIWSDELCVALLESESLKPMMLLASAAPIEAPTPAVPLTATDTAAAMMVA